jgi:hypothetical protein
MIPIVAPSTTCAGHVPCCYEQMLITSEESGMGGKSYTVKVYTIASESDLLHRCNSMLKMVYHAACNSQTLLGLLVH